MRNCCLRRHYAASLREETVEDQSVNYQQTALYHQIIEASIIFPLQTEPHAIDNGMQPDIVLMAGKSHAAGGSRFGK